MGPLYLFWPFQQVENRTQALLACRNEVHFSCFSCRGYIKSGQVYTSKVEFRFASFDKLEVIGIERSR